MRFLGLALVILAAACGSDATSGDGGTQDLSVTQNGADLFFLSRCGRPGDVGNSLGVGKFCTNQGPDCTGNGKATTCSALFNGQMPMPTDAYFCSFQCTAADPPGTCGENAECLCNASNLCACIPLSCVPATD